MTAPRGLLFAAALVATISSASLALSKDEDCLAPEVATDPDLSKLPDGQAFLDGLKTDYGTVRLREVRYDFAEANQIVRISQTFILDFSDVIKGIRSDGYRKTKERENCNTSLNPRDFALVPAADGDLRGGFLIDTTFRACQIFDVWCHKGGLEFGTCRVTWKEDIDSHTFGVNISLPRVFYTKAEKEAARQQAESTLGPQRDALEKIEEPIARMIARDKWAADVADLSSQLICGSSVIRSRSIGSFEADEVSFCGSSQFDERGYSVHDPVKNFFLNIIGIATFNIGSKFILDTYRSKLSDAHAAIDKAFYSNLPGRSQLIGSQGMSEVFMESMKIKQAATAFAYRGESNSRYEAFYHVSEHPEGKGVRKRTFCSVVRPVIAQYGALLRSTVTGDQEVTINSQSNLWNIAKAAYGSGYYHVTLLQPNNIAFRDAGRLSLGTKVTVPAMYKIWNGKSQVVQIGDSLWGIARRDLGNGSAYKTIVEQNAKFIDAPRRIYPIQLLQLTRQ